MNEFEAKYIKISAQYLDEKLSQLQHKSIHSKKPQKTTLLSLLKKIYKSLIK